MSINYNLDILISTFGSGVFNLENVILPFHPNVRYLVLHQAYKGFNLPQKLACREDVQYISSDAIGVTKSRNALLNSAKSDFVYFCDDDVLLKDNIYSTITDAFKTLGADIITFNVTNEYGALRKNYPSKVTNRWWFNILSVGTIEIAAKKESIKAVRFNELMGAGSGIPIGDEAVFLSDCLRSHLKISHCPLVVTSHPTVSSGACRGRDYVYARGYTIREVYGLFAGLIFLPVFFIARYKLFSDTFCGIKNLYAGFFKSRK